MVAADDFGAIFLAAVGFNFAGDDLGSNFVAGDDLANFVAAVGFNPPSSRPTRARPDANAF